MFSRFTRLAASAALLLGCSGPASPAGVPTVGETCMPWQERVLECDDAIAALPLPETLTQTRLHPYTGVERCALSSHYRAAASRCLDTPDCESFAACTDQNLLWTSLDDPSACELFTLSWVLRQGPALREAEPWMVTGLHRVGLACEDDPQVRQQVVECLYQSGERFRECATELSRSVVP